MSLIGKKLLIIGGSSGIGRATAAEAVAAGAQVIIAGRSQDHLTEAQEAIGDQVETCVLDVRDSRELDFWFEQMKGFDDLVVTAAEDYKAAFIESDFDEAKKAFETKFWGQYLAAQRCVPFIGERGSITLFSGVAGKRVIKGQAVLGAANCAVEALVKSLAVELSPLRINAVAPGEMRIEDDDEQNRLLSESLPVRRAGDYRDMASAVLFLIENQFTTGTVLRVDGGATAL